MIAQREVQSFTCFGSNFPHLFMGIFYKVDVHISGNSIVTLPRGNSLFPGKTQVPGALSRSILTGHGRSWALS